MQQRSAVKSVLKSFKRAEGAGENERGVFKILGLEAYIWAASEASGAFFVEKPSNVLKSRTNRNLSMPWAS